MNLYEVIAHIRTNVPILQNRVGGAADFQNAIESTVDMQMPAAYVIPLEDDGAENQSMNGLKQLVTERIGVIVATDASADRRGQAAVATVDSTKYAIYKALLNWRIDPYRATRGLKYDGGRILHFDRARIFWQYEFSHVVTITDADGFQPDGVPLTNINMNIDDLDFGLPIYQASVSAILGAPKGSGNVS